MKILFEVYMVALKNDIEIWSKEFLQAFDQGLVELRLNVKYPEVDSLSRVMFTMFAMLTICTRRDNGIHAQLVARGDHGIEQFIYGLGYSQLYAFFELQHGEALQ